MPEFEDIICGGKFIGDMDKYELRSVLLEKVREVKICYKVMTVAQARQVLTQVREGGAANAGI